MSEVNKEDFLLAMEVYACCSSLLMDCVYIFNQGGGSVEGQFRHFNLLLFL